MTRESTQQSDERRSKFPAVGKDDRNFLGPLDDVEIGNDKPFAINDNARSE